MKPAVRINSNPKIIKISTYMGWIKRYLTHHFPHTNFGFSVKRYVGGKSLRLTWTGNPRREELSGLLDLYNGSRIEDGLAIKTETIITEAESISTVQFGFDFIILNPIDSP